MVLVTHESYDSVLVGTGKQKGLLESLSENREWRRRCDVEWQVVPDGGTRNWKRQPSDCRETNGRNVQTMWGRRPQPSSGCHVGNTRDTRLSVGRRGAVDGSIRHNCQFEGDTFWNTRVIHSTLFQTARLLAECHAAVWFNWNARLHRCV